MNASGDPVVGFLIDGTGFLLLSVGVGPAIYQLRASRPHAAPFRRPLTGRLRTLARTAWCGVVGTYLLSASLLVSVLAGHGATALISTCSATAVVGGGYAGIALWSRRLRRSDDALAQELHELTSTEQRG